MSDHRFDGEGFAQTPIDGEEAARHRHMYREVSREWVPISGAVTVVNAIRIIAAVIKVGGPVGLLALGAGAYAKAQGWI